ncbi:hypothetical protein QR721_11970 [Aciduricibacillus chroicocephali]|uniref:Plasmid segregation centromere-binding protein ParR n=1 Tax=Aciduricibacillus chroicocephali TaxID=3054939 RepID=A0ABY9KU37_9BACI|nr:hypothetical protein QR721_11970 [Bacillaceae bacterium 44XB]
MRERSKAIERGQSITFRVPSDTPDYLLKQLQALKDTERRNFSSKIAGFVLKGVNETFAAQRETVTIPLPKALTKEQKSWLKHEHSEALLGTILYQLLSDPVRATTLLASMNSGSRSIDEALYLQETPVYSPPPWMQQEEPTPQSLATEAFAPSMKEEPVPPKVKDEPAPSRQAEIEASLDDLDMDSLFSDIHETPSAVADQDEEDPLGDFFADMNK